MSINTAVLLNSTVKQSSAADNATATATVAAVANMTHGILGVHADFSAAVEAVRTITLKKGTTVLLVLRHDFTLGPAFYPLPAAMYGDFGGAVSAELEASGTGGVSGRVALWTFSR